MIGFSMGQWSTAAGRFFVRERYYYRGRWTPLVRVRLRYLRTLRQAGGGA